MNPGLIERELRKSFEDWEGLLVNPRYCRRNNVVCWTSFKGGKLKEPVTSEQVLVVLEQKQFSFQWAEDGSLFQFLYIFDNQNVLTEARLAFYLIRSKGSFEDGTAEIKSTAWIRIDYDSFAAAGLLHSACHLHIHGFPQSRIVVDGVPGPRQFIEFIVATCYPDYYRMHRLSGADPVNVETMREVNACTMKLTGEGLQLIHLRAPDTMAPPV